MDCVGALWMTCSINRLSSGSGAAVPLCCWARFFIAKNVLCSYSLFTHNLLFFVSGEVWIDLDDIPNWELHILSNS